MIRVGKTETKDPEVNWKRETKFGVIRGRRERNTEKEKERFDE